MYNNIYKKPIIKVNEISPLLGFDKKYKNLADYIIEITYEIWEKKNFEVIKDTYTDNVAVHIGLNTFYGINSVIQGTKDTLDIFPDRAPYGEEVIWSEAKNNKYFSSHRLGSTATHLGTSQQYGKPTGKTIFFRTMADCIIKNNKIEEEWLVRDNYYILLSLGINPEKAVQNSLFNKYINKKISDERKLEPDNIIERIYFPSQDNISRENPAIALIFNLFKYVYQQKQTEKIGNYYHKNGLVHSICEERHNGINGIKTFYQQLTGSFSNVKIVLDRVTYNHNEYVEKVAVRWTLIGDHTKYGMFGEPSNKTLHVVGITHFEIVSGKIIEEWAVYDKLDVLCQIHNDKKSNGAVTRGANKKLVMSFFNKALKSACKKSYEKFFHTNAKTYISAPFKNQTSLENSINTFWSPLVNTFSDLEAQLYILFGGESEGKEYVAVAGNFIGHFEKDWIGIAANKKPIWLRFQASFLVESGKIRKTIIFLDILDLIRQAGFNLFPNRGVELLTPFPVNGDGIIDYDVEKENGLKTLNLVNDMLNCLSSYDGANLESMKDLDSYWDIENMLWYGPAGIGTTKGLKDFQLKHQIPFLNAFPDRGIYEKGDTIGFIGEGDYACHFGFPSMYGTHSGDGWLGLKKTDINITMRVMDFWRKEGNLLKENWVMIDMIDIFEQLGINIFELIKSKK